MSAALFPPHPRLADLIHGLMVKALPGGFHTLPATLLPPGFAGELEGCLAASRPATQAAASSVCCCAYAPGPARRAYSGRLRRLSRPLMIFVPASRPAPAGGQSRWLVFSRRRLLVDAGEAVEDCLRREVREEVGIEVAGLRYFGSQSWPFPQSLMLAYVCDYAGGEITPQPGAIEAAAWFDAAALPTIPMPMSIAGRLIRAVALQAGRR